MLPEDRYDSLIVYYASMYGRNPKQVKRQIRVESAFNPNAVSKAACVGLLQFAGRTWEEWRDGTAGIQPPPANLILCDPRDPEDCIRAGTAYMAALEKTLGSLPYALAAYNWGIGNVSKVLKDPATTSENFVTRLPDETESYIKKCTAFEAEKLVC